MMEPTDPDRLLSWPNSVVAVGNRTIISDGHQAGMQVYGPTGTIEARWNIRESLDEMSQADKQRCASRSIPRSYTQAQAEASIRRKIGDGRRRYWPAHGSILADDRGRVWVQGALRCDGLAPTWDVLDSNGALAAKFTLRLASAVPNPDDVMMLAIARDRILLWWTDSNGGPVVSLWRVEARKGGVKFN